MDNFQLVENFEYQGNDPDGAASDKQIVFFDRLAEERGFGDGDALAVGVFGTEGVGGANELTKYQASHLIETLLGMPRRNG